MTLATNEVIALIIAGIVGSMIAFGLISTVIDKRCAEKEWREFLDELQQESVASLRKRIVECDYWDLSVDARLRDTATVKEFFRRFDAEDYTGILQDGTGSRLCLGLAAAETEVGWATRPLLMDYDRYLLAVLKELASRPRGVRI